MGRVSEAYSLLLLTPAKGGIFVGGSVLHPRPSQSLRGARQMVANERLQKPADGMREEQRVPGAGAAVGPLSCHAVPDSCEPRGPPGWLRTHNKANQGTFWA